MLGSGSSITTATLSIINPCVGIVISSSTAWLTSIAIFFTNEYCSELKLRYTKLSDWINFITIPYEKTITQPMIDKKNHEKEALEVKKIYNHNLDKRKWLKTQTNSKLKVYSVMLFQKILFHKNQQLKLGFF